MALFPIPSLSFFAIKQSYPRFRLKRASGQPTCYFPNGEIAATDYACDQSASVSPCCGVDMICLDNQICRSNEGDYIRGSCTDPTWKSSDCPQYCTYAAAGGNDIISCKPYTNADLDFCCDGDDIADCCNTGVNRIRLPGLGQPMSTYESFANTPTLHLSPSSTRTGNSILKSSSSPVPSPSSSSSSFTAPTSSATQSETSTAQRTDPASTPLPSQTPSSTSASTLSTGAKAGIGSGASIGAIIIVVLSLLLWHSKRKNRSSKGKTKKHDPIPKGELDATEPQRPDRRVWELLGDTAPELEADREGNWIRELPAK